jgi:hypothetical protein
VLISLKQAAPRIHLTVELICNTDAASPEETTGRSYTAMATTGSWWEARLRRSPTGALAATQLLVCWGGGVAASIQATISLTPPPATTKSPDWLLAPQA